MNQRKWITAIASTLVFTLFAVIAYRAFSPRPVEASTVEVKIDNFSFSPATITVKTGTQIIWMNHDDIPHTVVEENKTFKSKVLDTDEKFTFTFAKPGTYNYYCSIHPKMTAKIVVK